MRRIGKRLILIPTILGHMTLFAAAPQQALQSDPRAEDLLARAISRDAHGPVTLTPRAAQVSLFVNDEPNPLGTVVLPIAPGAEIALRAEVDLAPVPPPEDATKPARLIRRTRHEEMLWSSTVSATLLAGTRGDVVFRAPTDHTGPIQVTAAVASLDIYRFNTGTFSPDEQVQAPLATTTASVWFLPGLTFDRTSDGILAGQNIGIYPNETSDRAPNSVRDRAELYRPPTTFFRLDEHSAGLPLTPHRTFAQLHPPAIATDTTTARLVPLSDRLIRFMTAFEANLESRGLRANRLLVIRGFVSPTDRLRLQSQGENMAAFSRFLYGDAVALVYSEGDEPIMGDFDGNGTVDVQDVQALADLAKATMDDLGMLGGLGIASRFPGTGPNNGQPYLHVDLRGFYAPFRE